MSEVRIKSATPIFFVTDVRRAAAFYRDSLGFQIDFLHSDPPFYGSVSRGDACIHLRLVHRTWFAERAASEESLILATIEVSDVTALHAEFQARGVAFAQPLEHRYWGGTDFQVKDPDGNAFSFVSYDSTPAATGLSARVRRSRKPASIGWLTRLAGELGARRTCHCNCRSRPPWEKASCPITGCTLLTTETISSAGST
jgi:uncharacterized glyoxalase superfamily protein PhnB